jgi:cytochrome oxidase assembly protein ShyY1
MLARESRKRIPYLATLIAFTAIVIMLGLGFWQLERKAEKDTRLTNIEKAKQSGSINIAEAFLDINRYQDFVVTGRGQVIENYFYIDNKLVDGRPGFHVLLPYNTVQGILMINLGWIPSSGARGVLPDVVVPSLSEIEGIVYLPQKNSLIQETNKAYGDFPVLLQQVDLDEISLHLGLPILPATLRLLPDDSSFVRQWQAVSMSPEKHLGYAIQWFGLAIAALTVYLLSMLKWMQGPPPVVSGESKINKKK